MNKVWGGGALCLGAPSPQSPPVGHSTFIHNFYYMIPLS